MLTTNNPYYQQLVLLVEVLREVATETNFALKGGTAINLFFRNLPRLSVDIDLTWLPVTERQPALRGITDGLKRLRERIATSLHGHAQLRENGAGVPTGLLIERQNVRIKIDVTPVMRGGVFAPEQRIMQPAAQDAFGFLEMQTMSFADVYAGKLQAALDRQHPRDLFDVMHLLAAEGITDDLWRAFLVYLTCHNRPAAELLDPIPRDITAIHAAEFAGMTELPIGADALQHTLITLITTLQLRLNEDDEARAFLLSVEHETPEWARLSLPRDVSNLPAIRWKLHNLAQRTPAKREADHRQLTDTLERIGRHHD